MYVRYQTKDTHARIECDRIAYHQDGRVMVLSCHGPQQTLRGLGAVLTSDAKVRLEHCEEDDCARALTKDGNGYRAYKHPLYPGLWHFLWARPALARRRQGCARGGTSERSVHDTSLTTVGAAHSGGDGGAFVAPGAFQ